MRAVVLVPLDSVDVGFGEGAPVVLALCFGQLPQNLLHKQVLLFSQLAAALGTSLTLLKQPEHIEDNYMSLRMSY